MKKRIISFLIACVMVASCFAFTGCDKKETGNVPAYEIGEYGDTGGLELPIDTENTKITMIGSTSAINVNDSAIFTELRKRTGLDIEVISIPTATLAQKQKVLLASKKDMPDVFAHQLSWQEVNEFGMQGAFEEILQHKDELPNFKKIFFDETKEHGTDAGQLQSMYSIDGGLYMFPQYDMKLVLQHGVLYRKDIFDKHGIKTWEDDEGFYKALKQLKEAYPESTPFVSKQGIAVLSYIAQFNNMRWPYEYYDEEAKTWKYGGADPKFYDILKFVKKLYDEELIDPEFLTATQAAWTNKITQADKGFVTIDWIGRMTPLTEQASPDVPGYDLRFAAPFGGGKMTTLSVVNAGPAVTKNEKSEKTLKLLDYLLSPSGAELMTVGIEGETYNMKDGKVEYIGFEGKKPANTELEDKHAMFITGTYMRIDRRSSFFQLTEREQEATDLMVNKKGGGFWPLDPYLTFTPEEADVLNPILVDLTKAAEEFATKFILEENTGDKQWNEWLKKAESIGLSKAIKILNTAQARYDKERK